MKLTAAAVNDLLKVCFYSKEEPHDQAILVEGIVHKYGFHPERLAANKPLIRELLSELPDDFWIEKGGGWSFLNACQDRHGNQWTGLHIEVEGLLCLGIAAGLAKWVLPKPMWEFFPGNMPYVSLYLES